MYTTDDISIVIKENILIDIENLLIINQIGLITRPSKIYQYDLSLTIKKKPILQG